ncbi:NlpC/P60 family protein [Stigmatella sp. ncwal1]|uniref:NlpC/P60 family protein n=1 Tax=Stigmatella ashevillensis TaxID=2995309 RepID=A0ABT5DPW8_9BACT|nr:CHAP domain-containing protein [Stigmatella ashevillena]MDC0714783.1 NlpC/P60 family protein [Stigmatella ashevillena]
MIRGFLLAWMLGVLGGAQALAAPPAAGRPSKAPTVSQGAPAQAKRPAARPPRGRRVAKRAVGLVGVSLASYRVPNDCSGLARLAYQAVGVELLSHGTRPGENAVSAIYRRAQARGALHRKTPQPGDLIFFRETYDRNRDGVRNDGLTHVGVVETVAKDGTVTFVHRGGPGVRRARMNPRFPTVRTQKGRTLNDYLRRADPTGRARLTGELFVGYASASRL